MKQIALALFLSGFLAYGQEALDQPTYFSQLPQNLRLLPNDYFSFRPLGPKPNLLLPKLNPLEDQAAWHQDFQTHRQTTVYYQPEALVLLAPEAMRLELSVIKLNSYPIDGSLGQQFAHVFQEGLANLGEYNTAVAFYQQPGYNGIAFSNGQLVNYDRAYGWARQLWSPVLGSVKRSAVAQLKRDARKIFHKRN
jgi:hypothetical protein